MLTALSTLLRRRSKAPIFSADFTTQSGGAGSLSSYGLSFSRSSSGHSVQTGTSTVSTSGSIGSNDAPRFGRRLDANNIGLVIEESRKNGALQNRDLSNAAWTTNGTVTTTHPYGTSPDGGNTATRCQTSGSNAYYLQSNSLSGVVTHSTWHQSVGGAVGSTELLSPSSGVSTTSTTWTRISTTSSSTPAYYQLQHSNGSSVYTGDAPAGPRDSAIDLDQAELGLFATEAIVNTTTALTRSGERLFLSAGSSLLASDNSLRFYAKLRPKGSSSGYTNDMRLWHVGANDHAEVVAGTSAVKTTIGGTAYTTATAASWAANDLVEFWVAAGGGSNATVVKYRVNGGSVTTLSTGSPPTQAAITISGAVDLLCNGTSNQFTAWVELIQFYQVGQTPTGF